MPTKRLEVGLGVGWVAGLRWMEVHVGFKTKGARVNHVCSWSHLMVINPLHVLFGGSVLTHDSGLVSGSLFGCVLCLSHVTDRLSY